MQTMIHFGLWSIGARAAETQTTLKERDCLARYAKGRKLLAEIGVHHGVTTCRLRAAMDPQGTLMAVDPYPVGRFGFSTAKIIAKKEVGKVAGGAVRWVQSTGAQAAADFAGTGRNDFDFLFIDGDHSYEGLAEDWKGWTSLVRPGGIITLHDSHSTPDRQIDEMGSVRFTREIILPDDRFQLLETVDSVTVLRRRE